MQFIAEKPDKPGKVAVQIMPTFLAALSHRMPSQVGDFSNFFTECETLILDECAQFGKDRPEPSAFGRARGDWYEWLFSLGSWEYLHNKEEPIERFFVPLPNRDKFDYLTLYNDRIFGYFGELKDSLEQNNVTLSSSNPDFAMIETEADGTLPPFANPITAELIEQLNSMCHQLVSQLNFEQFIDFVSVKTSVRGDRRLQLPAEAALVKAFYEHLKGRLSSPQFQYQ